MWGRRSFSRTFTAGHKSEMGRYEPECVGSFPGFGSGIMTEDFQIAGIEQEATELLNKWHRNLMP